MQGSQPPSSVARNSRIAISSVFLVFGLLVGSWLPHIPDVQKQLGVDYARLGSALLCSGFGAVAVMPILGSIIHRFGSRHVTFVAAIGACLLVPELVVHATLAALAINLAIVGVCYGALDVAMNSHSVHVQSIHESPIIAGIHGWFSLGGIVGGLAAAMATSVGISPLVHLLIISAASTATLIVGLPYLLPTSIDQNSDGAKLVLPKSILLMLGIFCMFAFASEGGILDWSALYIRSTLGARPAFGGIVTATCSGTMAWGRFAGDKLIVQFGNRKVVGISGLATFASLLGAVATHSLALTIVLFAFAGFGIANMVPVFFKEAGNIPGVPTGAAMAAVTTCGYAGFLLGPPIIGNIAHTVSLGFSLGLLGMLGLIVGVGSQFVLHDKHV